MRLEMSKPEGGRDKLAKEQFRTDRHFEKAVEAYIADNPELRREQQEFEEEIDEIQTRGNEPTAIPIYTPSPKQPQADDQVTQRGRKRPASGHISDESALRAHVGRKRDHDDTDDATTSPGKATQRDLGQAFERANCEATAGPSRPDIPMGPPMPADMGIESEDASFLYWRSGA